MAQQAATDPVSGWNGDEVKLRRDAILSAVPRLNNGELDKMIGLLFSDDALCTAYLQVIVSRYRDTPPTLALNRSIQAMKVAAAAMELLLPRERPVAALAAFLKDSGWYLCLQAGKTDGMKPSDWDQEDYRDMRQDVLAPLLKNLRQRSPAMANLLAAALGHEEMVDDQGGGLDEQQVARVRVAIERASRPWA